MQLTEDRLEDWLELTCPDVMERDRRRAEVHDRDWWERRGAPADRRSLR